MFKARTFFNWFFCYSVSFFTSSVILFPPLLFCFLRCYSVSSAVILFPHLLFCFFVPCVFLFLFFLLLFCFLVSSSACFLSMALSPVDVEPHFTQGRAEWIRPSKTGSKRLKFWRLWIARMLALNGSNPGCVWLNGLNAGCVWLNGLNPGWMALMSFHGSLCDAFTSAGVFFYLVFVYNPALFYVMWL